jgi:twinkle protein
MNLTEHDKFQAVREKANIPSTAEQWRFSNEFIEFFKIRGLYNEAFLKKQLVYEPMPGVVGFAYQHRFSVKNVKFRKISDKRMWQISQDLGSVKCYYGIDDIDEDTDYAIIVEGEPDALTLKLLGYKNVLSCPDGAPAEGSEIFDSKFDFLQDPYTVAQLKHIKTFFLATDDDKPGDLLRDYLSGFYGRDRCKKFTFPEKYKDVNEIYAGSQTKQLPPLGSSGIATFFQSASFFPIKGLISVRDISAELVDFAENGYQPGLKIGNEEVDKVMSIKRGHTSVWTGVSGSGKSTYLRWHCTELCKYNPEEKIKIAVFAPESETAAREAVRTMEVYAQKQYFKDDENPMTEEERLRAKAWVDKHFVYILPTRKEVERTIAGHKVEEGKERSLRTLLAYVKTAHDRTKQENGGRGLFGYVIDTWNRADDEKPDKESETKWIGKMLDMIDEFNQEHQLHGFIVAHPTKVEQLKSGNFKTPSLYDIYGSSNWKNKVYLGVIIHRNKYRKSQKKDEEGNETFWRDNYAPTQVIVEKLKFEELGTEGRTQLFMDRLKGGIFVNDDSKIDKRRKKGYDPNAPKIPMDGFEDRLDDDAVFLHRSEEKEDLPF